MTAIISLDAETFYDKDYSLSKLTTEAYIRDPRFEVIGVSIMVNDAGPFWFSGTRKEIRDWLISRVALEGVDWKDALLLCHNTAFDAAILNWQLGIRPKGYLDTMSMANALHGVNESVSLKSLAERYGLPDKGTEVLAALGKNRKDFTPEELEAYGEYCRKDAWLCRTLFDIMAERFSKAELKAIDVTIRMFAEPVLVLDKPLLEQHLLDVRAGQKASMTKLCDLLGHPGDEDSLKKVLNSNPQLAGLLQGLGVEPPMKISPTTGKETYAFAKTDEEFTALLDHEDPIVQAAVAARLGNKTSIEETRTKAFIEIAGRGTFPFPLKYSGASVSHRWSGFDVNVQNLLRGGKLRQSIKAPPGYKIVAADLSNIELRLGLYMAMQDDKIDLIRAGRDLYMDIGVPIFGKTYEEIEALGKKSRERTTGKVCLAEGSPVLTPRGLVPIEQVLVDDLVWDGVEWVSHEGPIYQGEQHVIQYQGVEATPDHIVYLQDGSTCGLGVAASKMYNLACTGDGWQELRLGGCDTPENNTPREACVPAHPMQHLQRGEVGGVDESRSWCSWLSHMFAKYWSTTPTKPHTDRREISLHKPQRPGVPPLRWAWDSVRVFFRYRSGVVGAEKLAGIPAWAADRSEGQRQGVCTGESAVGVPLGEFAQHPAGIQSATVSSLSRDLSSGAIRRPHTTAFDGNANRCGDSTPLGAAVVQTKRRVWDLLNAGPRHRFTAAGKLVSNCQLSSIYGTGHEKLQSTLRIQGKVKFSKQETKVMTDLYRGEYTKVVEAWAEGKEVLDAIYHKSNYGDFLRPGILRVDAEGIWKPSGLLLAYPDLRWTKDPKDGKMGYTYEQKRKSRDRVYGSKCFQRVIQSLARDIICEHMLKIDKRYLVVGTVHDEIICLVAEDEVEEAEKFMLEVMRTPPSWCDGSNGQPSLPLDAEVGHGDNYGGAH